MSLILTRLIFSFSDELIRVDELIEAIHKLQTIPDASRMEKIIEVLGKIDNDKDGVVKVDDLLKVCFTHFVYNLPQLMIKKKKKIYLRFPTNNLKFMTF